MIGLLEEILCALLSIAALILTGLVEIVNGIIIGLGAFLAVIVALLPNMPEPPSMPSSGVLTWFTYFVPIAGIVTVAVSLAGLFATFMVVRFALNWLRAL